MLPFVTCHEQIVIDGAPLTCPTCRATCGHRVQGLLGEEVTVTCKDGHSVTLPPQLNHTVFFMHIASEPGVSMVPIPPADDAPPPASS